VFGINRHPYLRWSMTGLLACFALSPALFIARLIFRYGVDVPFADEWVWVSFFFKAHEHSLTLADFFAQHNEHRYFFPSLILLVLAPLTSGNIRGEMFFSLAVTVLTSGLLWYLLSRTVEISLNKRLLLLGLLNLILFSPVQAENWTWGYQFVLLFTNLLLVAGVAVAISRRSVPIKFSLCFALAGIATFSFGGGVIAWPLTFPLGLAVETSLRKRATFLWLLGWLAAAGALVALYFFHYVKPPSHPPLFASPHPADYLLYVTTFLGGHLFKATRTEPILVAAENGTLLLLLYLGGLFWTIRSRAADFRKKMVPWLGLGAFAVLNAILAATTRIGFGINQALDSRYTTFSLFISLSVIGMLGVIATTQLHRGTNPPVLSFRWLGIAWLFTACPTLLLIAHLNASWWGIGSMRESQRNRLHGKAALLFTNVLPEAGNLHARYLIANAAETPPWANMANGLGYIHPALLQGPELSGISSRPQHGGFLEKLIAKPGGTCEASGWAIIPKGRRPADAILLTYDDPVKGPTVFTIATPDSPRAEVIEALHDARYEYSGWSCEFDRAKVPRDGGQITAWSFDAEKMIVYPLLEPQRLQ
jgi:hypothetical protein